MTDGTSQSPWIIPVHRVTFKGKYCSLFAEEAVYVWPLNLLFSLQFAEVCHSTSTKKISKKKVNKAEFSLLRRLHLNGL